MAVAVEVVAQREPVRRAVRAYPASANRPSGSPVTARPAPMMSHADLLALQRTVGNHAVARHVVQRQGTPGGNGGGRPATAAPAGPVGARTRRPIADLEREFRGLITAARGRGYPVAADNLEHFLTGGGATRSVPQTWLRSFSVVTEAERKNQERFEDQLKTRAKALAAGGSTTLSDWWAAVVRASMGTELYFASGVSQLNSTGTFALSRAGQVVTIIGTTVNLRWFDPYNWNPGSSAWIPGHGVVSDDVGLDLKDAGRGHDYLLENLYTQTLAATYTIRPWYLPNLSSFAWATL